MRHFRLRMSQFLLRRPYTSASLHNRSLSAVLRHSELCRSKVHMVYFAFGALALH